MSHLINTYLFFFLFIIFALFNKSCLPDLSFCDVLYYSIDFLFIAIKFQAFQGNNISTITAINAADVPPDLVNPGDIEMILDIRKEYALKLEEVIFNLPPFAFFRFENIFLFWIAKIYQNSTLQSEERARKLRADLAIEEHRGQELGRILKEIIPDPKTSSALRSRRGRRVGYICSLFVLLSDIANLKISFSTAHSMEPITFSYFLNMRS